MPEHDCVLVRYGELALKSRRVRLRFTERLRDFIIDAFQAEGLDCVVEADDGHLYVYSSDLEAATSRLARVFGVVSVSPAMRLGTSAMGDVAEAVAGYSGGLLAPGDSFAIRARRTGEHDYGSMDLAREAGSAVWKAMGGKVSVDLEDPNLAIEVEVRGNVTYVYHQRIAGVGGLPPGTQGRVLCPIRETPDAVAGWMMMRRGCGLVTVVIEGDERAAGLADSLGSWDPRLRPRQLPEAEWEWTALYREMGRSRASGVVVGDRGPGVPRLPPDRHGPPVVFHPLVGLDDGTYARLESMVLSGELDLPLFRAEEQRGAES